MSKTEARVPLTFPITVDGQEITELILTRPKVGLLLNLKDLSIRVNKDGGELTGLPETLFAVIEGCTKLKRQAVEELDLVDLVSVFDEIMGFFVGSPISGMLSRLSPTPFTSDKQS